MTFTGVIRIMVASLALATIPATAHAQSWFLSPFLGIKFSRYGFWRVSVGLAVRF